VQIFSSVKFFVLNLDEFYAREFAEWNVIIIFVTYKKPTLFEFEIEIRTLFTCLVSKETRIF